MLSSRALRPGDQRHGAALAELLAVDVVVVAAVSDQDLELPAWPAISAEPVIPLAASGGATAEAHRLLGGRPDRGHLTADELTDLGTITEAEPAAALVERILRRKADTTP